MTRDKSALIIVDMTNDFIFREHNPGLALERAREMIAPTRRLQEAFLKRGFPVIYTSDRHLESDYELKKWGKHSMKGSGGSEIVEGLEKKNLQLIEREWTGESVRKAASSGSKLFDVEKGTYSSFVDNGGKPTALEELLKSLGIEGGSNLYITGLHAACGVKHTTADAWFRGYSPVIISDCVDSFDSIDGELGMDKDQALNYIKYWYNADVATSEQVLENIGMREEPVYK